MSIALADGTVITGSAITGLTSPTYTLKADVSPDTYTKQYYVSAIGGTQTGVNGHSVERPFTLAWSRQKVLKTQNVKSAATGMFVNVSKNHFKLKIRKGGELQAGQYDTLTFDADFGIPVGFASYSPAEVNAYASFIGGCVATLIQGVADSLKNGVL